MTRNHNDGNTGGARQAPLLVLGMPGATLACLGIGFQGALENIVIRWYNQEEYSHGYLIVLVSLYLLWRKRDELRSLEF